MVFTFIRYTQPAWMFNIIPKEAREFASCYYHPQLLPLPENVSVDMDDDFETPSAKYADIGYTAWNRGALIWADAATIQRIKDLPPPTLQDEYTFIAKYWGRQWALLTLVRRLMWLHNPVKELACYKKASAKKRIRVHANALQHIDYHSFASGLVDSQPLVAVIIPTLNRYLYLKDVLSDLEKQDYSNFEVIVVDQSEPYNEQFYQDFNLKLNVIRQTEKLLWTARNRAICATKAEYLLFFDDDLRVDEDWITHHLKCLDYFNAEISAGVSLAVVGAKVPESYNFFRWADQFDSGNAMVKRDVFKRIGLFDLNFNKQSMGDGEFGIRAYTNGIKSISNPFAKRIHLKVAAGGLREIGHWDGFRPKRWFAPKPIPSVVYLYKKYFPKSLSRNALLLGIMLSNVSYRSKRKNNMLFVSIVLTIIKAPVLAIQYMRARKIAHKMLAKTNTIVALEQ